jgi:hypothetical protein
VISSVYAGSIAQVGVIKKKLAVSKGLFALSDVRVSKGEIDYPDIRVGKQVFGYLDVRVSKTIFAYSDYFRRALPLSYRVFKVLGAGGLSSYFK